MTTVLDLPAKIGTHVTIRGLDKSFNGAVLYKDFNLDIPKGKIVRCGDVEIDSSSVLYQLRQSQDQHFFPH